MRIVVLGAGFAGIEATLTLEKKLKHRPDIKIVLVSDQNYLLFTPLLPQIVSSAVEPRHIIQDIRTIRGRNRRFRFVRNTVQCVRLDAKRVELADRDLRYDYLIIALGSTTNYFSVSGAAEHAFSFKSLQDAVELRDVILDLCEHADQEMDPREKQRLLTWVVVGGGYTGVELICEMSSFLARQSAKYHGIATGDARLVLLEAAGDILRGLDPELAARARVKINGKHIEVRTNAPVAQCLPDGVEILGEPSELLRAGVVVWAGGVKAHDLCVVPLVKRDRIVRFEVNEHLSLAGFPEVFCAGDTAVAVGEHAKGPSIPIAPVAIAQGKLAAENVARAIAGEPPAPYEFSPSGMLVSLGMRDAVIEVKGVRVSGFWAWLFWNAVHLYKLVGLKKQIQVALDLFLATVFPSDAAIIRTPPRCARCAME